MKFIKLRWETKRFIKIGSQDKKDLLNEFDKSKYFFENFSQINLLIFSCRFHFCFFEKRFNSQFDQIQIQVKFSNKKYKVKLSKTHIPKVLNIFFHE